MDISFDIKNAEGDQIMVALSYYDTETTSIFTSDPLALTLVFYDVTLVRISGEGYVGFRTLSAISDVLARFMHDNEDAVLCFYCDSLTDVKRSHKDLVPQEYRSKLFSKMFDLYIRSHKLSDFVNHRVEIKDSENPQNSQYAHFICRTKHSNSVKNLGILLAQK